MESRSRLPVFDAGRELLRRRPRTWELLVRIVVVIAVVEAGVMAILHLAAIDGPVAEAILAAALLALLSTPLLLLFVIGPVARVFRHEARLARQAARNSEARYRSVAETTVDGIIVANAEGEVISWNEAAQRIFGYAEEEILGQDLTTLMPPRLRRRHRRALREVVATGTGRILGSTVELTGLHRDGREFPIELSLGSWGVDGERRFSGIVRDITERKRQEGERESLIAELRSALEEIKTLRGLVPICANCKKVRRDEGYWSEIEQFIADHSEAEFSHGLCPRCVEELYPESG